MNESNNSSPLIYTHGGYRKLKSFQISQLAYDVTVRFCNRYIEKRSRTHDQMCKPPVRAFKISPRAVRLPEHLKRPS